MALPSSPPLLPTTDLPESPALLPTALPIGAQNRKRQLSDYGSLSSDPLFSDAISEVDHESGSDQPQRKRVVRGPWWNLRRTSGRELRLGMIRKESTRNADSGVWMGSDDGIDSVVSSQQQMQRLEVREPEEHGAPHENCVPDAESLAARFIQRCLDEGKETVDLSDLGLTSLSSATLRPLHQLIRHNHADLTRPPSEDEFTPLTPSIQLFLSKNALRSLPPELFTLVNLTVLSLRANKLAELPPSVSQLQNLKELNIAGNRIRHLPWELLELIHCRGAHRQINLRPNPLVQPTDLSGPSPLGREELRRMVKSEDFSRFADTRATYQKLREKCREEGCLNSRTELELRLRLGRLLRIQYLQDASRAGRQLQLCREELIYLAGSGIRCLDVDGSPLRCVGNDEEWNVVLDPIADAPKLIGSMRAPSLFELALRKLQSNFNLHDLVPQLPESDLSSRLVNAIQRAANNDVNYGNEKCTSCGRQFVIARAEWVEYWFNGYSSQDSLTPETVLPFKRRACSWACAKPSDVGEYRC